MTSRFKPEAIQNLLHDPKEIDVEEYRIIHARLSELLRNSRAADVGLRTAIESCHRFSDWADATRAVLESLLDEIVASAKNAPGNTCCLDKRPP